MRHSLRIVPSIVTVAAVTILTGPVNAPGVRPASAETTAVEDCVSLSLAESDQGLTYEFANACEPRLSCRMSWKVVCGDDRSGPARPGSKHFTIASGASTSIEISVATCRSESWLVDDVSWTCEHH